MSCIPNVHLRLESLSIDWLWVRGFVFAGQTLLDYETCSACVPHK